HIPPRGDVKIVGRWRRPNKCLAQNNKSRRVIRATKDRHEWASTVADMSERYPLVYRLLGRTLTTASRCPEPGREPASQRLSFTQAAPDWYQPRPRRLRHRRCSC